MCQVDGSGDKETSPDGASSFSQGRPFKVIQLT